MSPLSRPKSCSWKHWRDDSSTPVWEEIAFHTSRRQKSVLFIQKSKPEDSGLRIYKPLLWWLHCWRGWDEKSGETMLNGLIHGYSVNWSEGLSSYLRFLFLCMTHLAEQPAQVTKGLCCRFKTLSRPKRHWQRPTTANGAGLTTRTKAQTLISGPDIGPCPHRRHCCIVTVSPTRNKRWKIKTILY